MPQSAAEERMRRIRFSGVYTRTGWLDPAELEVSRHGTILGIGPVSAQPPDEQVEGYLLKGIPNAHSHAFQYALVGLSESRSGRGRDFWDWRERIYSLALRLTPEAVEAVATLVYCEMLRYGYTSVIEFHYLHHDPEGRPYTPPWEMGARLMAAAQEAGMDLTLLPVYYRRGDFGREAAPEQRRFIFSGCEQYLGLLQGLEDLQRRYFPGVRLGHGLHSLRAADPEEARQILSESHSPGPIHLHVSEQLREVQECRKAWGSTPVRWLLDHVPLSPRHALIHATHEGKEELEELARSPAVVVLCPSTEGNLGDGRFPLERFHGLGGQWCIGSDSQVGLNPFEELRWLDYQSRIASLRRDPLARPPDQDTAEALFSQAVAGGGRAEGIHREPGFGPGDELTGVVLCQEHPLLAGKPPSARLASLLYGGDSSILRGTLVRSEWVVREGCHRQREKIRSRYLKILESLPR